MVKYINLLVFFLTLKMELLINCNLDKNVMFTGLLKYFTFTFLIWTYHTYNDLRIFPKSLEKKHEHHNVENLRFCRLLGKYEQKMELRDTRFKDKLPDINLHKNRRNVSDHISTYSEVHHKASSNLDAYMKGYKDRHMKKKGLSKLDCYYENKLFGKFNHMCDIAEKMQNNKKSWKSFFFKKYGIGLIIFGLLPSLGLIFHILYGIGKGFPGIFGECPDTHFNNNIHKNKEDLNDLDCTTKWLYEQKNTIETYGYISYIYVFTICMVVLLFVSYILIKFIKYERLKAEKCKINKK